MLRAPAFLLGLVVTASLAPLSAQQTPKRRPGPFLIFGPVHSIRDERAAFKNEHGAFVEEPRTLVQTIEYNEDGTRQDRTSYAEGNHVYRTLDIYDPDGRILESKHFRGGALESRVVSNYDDHKQLTEQLTYRPDSSIQGRVVFKLQGNQREVESWAYDTQGNVIAQSKTLNDLPAKRSTSISISPGGVSQTESSVIENPDGSWVRTEQSNGSIKRQVIADGHGSEDWILYDKGGTIKSKERILREFDSHQNMIKETRLNAIGDSADFTPSYVAYRTITYFEKD
jgi:antitoxin component YwqK of YwqJK toxin-antitoxin module